MSEELIGLIKKNVIQGRTNTDDEGMDDDMVGQPGVVELVQQGIDSGMPVKDLITLGLTAGMDEVGKKFEAGEYFIPDMLASAEAVGAAMEILEPHLAQSGIKTKGKVLMVTVKGDFHDIGKNIVSILLRGAGYIVKDIGNDVAPETIVTAIKEEKPAILGLSALLTSTMANMKTTIQAIEASGIRDQVKIVVGGAPVSQEFAQTIGADGYGADGFQALAIVESLAGNTAG